MALEGPLHLLPVDARIDTEPVADMDPLDHEHTVVDLDLARRLR